jgi:predicted phosphodiesterase
MPAEVIRIFSDLHYGDRSSRINHLAALAPLAEGAARVILNGDSLDTRPGPSPAHNAQTRADLEGFFSNWGPPVTFLTGNHDPDFTPYHYLDLSDGRIFITHGDILYPDIVPWGRDAPLVRRRMAAAWRASPVPKGTASLAEQFAVQRAVALSIPQRHQSERNRWRYLRKMATDMVWPPWRVPATLAAWGAFPRLADHFVTRFRPQAEFMLTGHTHRPGLWRRTDGVTVINTGSLCRPFGALAVDLREESLRIRTIEPSGAEFRLGGVVAELRLGLRHR